MISTPIAKRRSLWKSSIAIVLLAAITAGCAGMSPPKPWEKGTLARSEMQLDPDPLESKLDQHIYSSKEAASGGYGAGGGGCGCN